MDDKQVEQELLKAKQDFVYGTIYEMLCKLASVEIPWDIEILDTIALLVQEYFCNKLKIMSKDELL